MRTVRYLVDKHAAEQPDKVFLIAPEPNLELTYGQLQEDCRDMGRWLASKGIGKDDKVSFMLPNCFQSVKVLIGVMYAGSVIAPLNLQAQHSQLVYVLDHSDTKLVIIDGEEEERLKKAIAEVDRDIEYLIIDKDARQVLPTKGLNGAALPEIGEEDAALLLYTSGTTGVPKGVILAHRSMVAGGEYVVQAHELIREDRALCSLVLFHINAQVVSIMSTLVIGSSVVVPHKFSASAFWEVMSDYQCTWFSVVPTIISYLASGSEIKDQNLKLDQIRFGRSASSALPQALHKRFEDKFGIGIVETMGLTETAAPVFSNPLDPAKRKYGSPGEAVGNTAKIINEKGGEVDRGTVGEIMIKGDNVMREYYKAPEITAQTLLPDGWLHTGDLGYMDEDGFVFVTGRLKELIIKGGENIAPREIDEALYRHPAILDAAAVGIPDEHYGEEILACVTLQPGRDCTIEELLAHCLEHLGKYKTPKEIKILEELPKGPSGKIQRLKLPELLGY